MSKCLIILAHKSDVFVYFLYRMSKICDEINFQFCFSIFSQWIALNLVVCIDIDLWDYVDMSTFIFVSYKKCNWLKNDSLLILMIFTPVFQMIRPLSWSIYHRIFKKFKNNTKISAFRFASFFKSNWTKNEPVLSPIMGRPWVFLFWFDLFWRWH